MSAQAAGLPASGVVAGFLAFALMGAVQAMYGAALPGLSRAFHLPAGTAGLLLSAHGLGALLGVLGSGALAGRPAARWRVGGATLLLSLGALGVGLAPLWPLALLGALTVGLGYGALTAGLNSLFARSFGARSAAMLSVLNALFGVGAVAGPLLVGAFAGGARTPFGLVGAACALLLPLALRLDDRPAPAQPPRGAAAGRPALLGFVALLALSVGFEASSVGWMASYLVSLGNTVARAASFTALYFVTFTLARLVAAPLSLRFSPFRMVLTSLGLSAACWLLAAWPAAAPASVTLLGVGMASLFPSSFLWLSRALPGIPGATTWALSGALSGAALFPAGVGWLVSALGPSVIPRSALLLAVAAAVAALLLRRTLR